jgi:acyl carrier protein
VTRTELKQIVADVLEIDPEALEPTTELKSFETFDSVSVLSLMIELDEKAGIKLGPGDAAKLATYGEIEALATQQHVTLTD